MIQLYNYYRSSASFRVRIALNFKNIPYQDMPVHLTNHGGEQYSEEYQRINPQSLVPALKDGDKIITQSLAIIEYLEDCYPEPALLPKDPYQKALIRSFAYAIACDIHPINNLRVLNYLKDDLKLSEDAKNQWYQTWIHKGFAALEKKIQNTAGDYCFGGSLTMADLFLVPQMYNARRFSIDLKNYPTLVRIDQNCQKNSAIMQAWPVEPNTINEK